MLTAPHCLTELSYCISPEGFDEDGNGTIEYDEFVEWYLLRGNIHVTPLRFKLRGRPVLSARFNIRNIETAGSERKRPEI